MATTETHEATDPARAVLNQPPAIEPMNLFEVDVAMSLQARCHRALDAVGRERDGDGRRVGTLRRGVFRMGAVDVKAPPISQHLIQLTIVLGIGPLPLPLDFKPPDIQ